MPYVVLAKHQSTDIKEENQMEGAILKLGKILAFPVLIGIWLIGWTLYSKGDNAQVSDQNRKILIIKREDPKK